MEPRDPETLPVGPEDIRKLYQLIAELRREVEQLKRRAVR